METISVAYEQKIQEMLVAIRSGNREEFESLIEAVRQELDKLSAHFLRKTPIHTLQTTALVNEVVIRLLKVIEKDPGRMPATKQHFINLTCQMMKYAIIDYRKKKRVQAVSIEADDGVAAAGSEYHRFKDLANDETGLSPENALALTEVLEELSQEDYRNGTRKSEIVQLRFLGGMTYPEIADSLWISTDSARHGCESGLRWLREKLARPDQAASPR
ncbi:MAG TPA: sigma-70 family RNA polymerase sigma factor [Blastocatellia bacterium]|nr:sigma-70 family RNA polymerase sigma factor [Blastocatellia bacterium]